MFGRRKKQQKEDEETRQLLQREIQLGQEMAELQNLLEEVPLKEKKRLEEQRRRDEEDLLTIPPPDELRQRARERSFYEGLSKGKVRNQKKEVVGNFFLLLILLGALIFTGLWVMRVYSGN